MSRLGLAEHVRMAADELRVHGAGDAVEVAVALLLEQQRQEVDLEEQVAELVVELGRIVGERRVGDLVGLLDRVRDDRARGLLAIPRALGAQAPGQLPELGERVGGATRPIRRSVVSVAGRRSEVVRRLEAGGVRDLALVLLLGGGGPVADGLVLALLERAAS